MINKNQELGKNRLASKQSAKYRHPLLEKNIITNQGEADINVINLYSAYYASPLYQMLENYTLENDEDVVIGVTNYIQENEHTENHEPLYLFLCSLYDKIQVDMPSELLSLGTSKEAFMLFWYEFCADWLDIYEEENEL